MLKLEKTMEKMGNVEMDFLVLGRIEEMGGSTVPKTA